MRSINLAVLVLVAIAIINNIPVAISSSNDTKTPDIQEPIESSILNLPHESTAEPVEVEKKSITPPIEESKVNPSILPSDPVRTLVKRKRNLQLNPPASKSSPPVPIPASSRVVGVPLSSKPGQLNGILVVAPQNESKTNSNSSITKPTSPRSGSSNVVIAPTNGSHMNFDHINFVNIFVT